MRIFVGIFGGRAVGPTPSEEAQPRYYDQGVSAHWLDEVAFLVGQSRSTETPGVEALLAEGRAKLVELLDWPTKNNKLLP